MGMIGYSAPHVTAYAVHPAALPHVGMPNMGAHLALPHPLAPHIAAFHALAGHIAPSVNMSQMADNHAYRQMLGQALMNSTGL